MPLEDVFKCMGDYQLQRKLISVLLKSRADVNVTSAMMSQDGLADLHHLRREGLPSNTGSYTVFRELDAGQSHY